MKFHGLRSLDRPRSHPSSGLLQTLINLLTGAMNICKAYATGGEAPLSQLIAVAVKTNSVRRRNPGGCELSGLPPISRNQDDGTTAVAFLGDVVGLNREHRDFLRRCVRACLRSASEAVHGAPRSDRAAHNMTMPTTQAGTIRSAPRLFGSNVSRCRGGVPCSCAAIRSKADVRGSISK
jgi:hypothetical protein